MKKYSLKEVFYKNRYLLNEMAIITPRNFLERTVKLCSDKPVLIGIPSITSIEDAFDYIEDNLYKKHKYMTQADVNKFIEELQAEYDEKESSRQKSVEIRKSKGIKVNEKDLQPIKLTDDIKQQKLDLFEATAVKEKTILLEILKIVKVTNILELKGKDDKKKLKEAEDILSVQLRKHMNSDGEGIEFKNILPMYDNILTYVQKKADTDFNLCIKNADLYMRNFYNIARKEEKDIIDRGDFDFDIIMKRMLLVNQDKEETKVSEEHSSRNKENYVHIFEDEDMVILYPRTYDKFRYILKDVYEIGPDFSWCTYASAGTWTSYNSNEYVAIAHSKKVAHGDPAWAISLKITKAGEINGPDTCDYDNNHVTEDFINNWFSNEAREAIRELPKIVDLIIDPEKMRETIKNYAELNDINSIKENIIKSFAYCGEEETQNFFSMLCQESPLSEDVIAEIIVETICYFMFDSPSAEFEYFQDFFNTDTEYPTQKIYNRLKEKISNSRSHVRYFNGFLILQKLAGNKITELTFEEMLEATKIACSSTNTNNLKRIINLLLSSDKYSKYLNPFAMTNKKAGLTSQNISFYDMLINTSCVKEYIKINGAYALKNAAKTIVRAEEFLARLLFRYKDILIDSIQENNPDVEDPITDIDLTLAASYIGEEARGTTFFNFSRQPTHKFLTIDPDTYNDLKLDMFSNYETWSLLKDKFNNEEARNLFGMLYIEIISKNKNIEINDTLFKIFNDIMSFPSYNITNIFIILYTILNKFNKDLTDFDQKTLLNIKNLLTTFAREESEKVSEHLADAIANSNKIDQKESDYRYKLYSLLDDTVKNKIMVDVVSEITMMFRLRYKMFYEFLANFDIKSKKFFEGLNINNIIKQTNSNIFRLIACFLDFVPLNDKVDIFAEFIEYLINPNGPEESHKWLESNVIEKLDISLLNHPKVLEVFNRRKFAISQMYGKHSFMTNLINYILQLFNDNNIAFPKAILQSIILNNKNNSYASLEGAETLLTNFINISEDGGHTLYGKELTIVRDTLKTLYNFKGGINKHKNLRIQSSGLLFKMPQVKEIVFKLVSKMNKHARMHMTLAFPDERSQLIANTPEEDAELQADSLIRMYVKMLLS